MANTHVVLGHTAPSTSITDGLKLDVMYLTYRPGQSTPSEIVRALDGSTVMSVGIAKRTWSFVARVLVTAATGYASLSNVDGWYADATAAGNLWKFQGLQDATIYNVVIANKGAYNPKPLSPAYYAADAVWVVPIELIEQ